jgi:hypothetical protein
MAHPTQLFESPHDFTDRQGHQWSIEITWSAVRARIEPVGIKVLSVGPGLEAVPLTAETLRRIPFGTLVDNFRREKTEKIEQAMAAWWAEPLASEVERVNALRTLNRADALVAARVLDATRHERELRPYADELRSYADAFRPRKGRKITDDDLRIVADVYRTAWRQGADPRRAVAEQFHLSDSGAAKRIRAARDAGFLGQARPGKAGEV